MSYMMPFIGGGLGALSGAFTPNYGKLGGQYADTLNQIASSFNPYVNQGFMAKKGLGMIDLAQMGDPTALQNRVAGSFEASPYQKQIMQNTRDQMNMNAAQTGMLGSTAQQSALQHQMADLNNQFQQQYIDRAMHHYDQANQNLQSLGMMMGQQGFQGSQAAAELQAQGALGRLEAGMMPGQWQSMFGDALGGMIGMMK